MRVVADGLVYVLQLHPISTFEESGVVEMAQDLRRVHRSHPSVIHNFSNLVLNLEDVRGGY